MMMTPGSPLAYTVFVLVCLIIITLPFIPAFMEWLRPTDIAALPVLANYTSDIDHFARRLHSDVMARLGDSMPTGHEDFEVLPRQAAGQTDWSAARRRMISHEIDTDAAINTSQQLYVRGNIRAGANSAFPSLYATGDIDLGPNSAIKDWAHADGKLRMRANGVALRRISADKAIELGTDTWFERMNAPAIYFGGRRQPVVPAAKLAQTPGSYADLPDAVEQTPLLFLVRGNCVLAAGKLYTGSLVVTGFLVIGAGTTVAGDVKAREGVSMDHSARIEGAITCEKRVYVFNESQVFGPVIAEGDLLIGAGAVVGLPDSPTTVSAANIIVEDGVVVHGTIWAHEIGMVKPV
ncbi:MAG: polymer-forming cytoskeletal protein [Bdellovibrionales bacterium]|nr:polymer-forming cytoskeletal protein [Ramlibacter sp.]